MITITLRNNLMGLITWKSPEFIFAIETHHAEDVIHPTLRRILFTFLALIPSFGIAFVTNNVDILVSVTGGFAGLAIMFVFPAAFVFFARRCELSLIFSFSPAERQTVAGVVTPREIGINIFPRKLQIRLIYRYRSPFASQAWVYLIFVWSVFALVGQIFVLVRRYTPHHQIESYNHTHSNTTNTTNVPLFF